MAEYVCELTDDYPGIEYGDDEYSGTAERRERIVRCRDCRHMRLEYGNRGRTFCCENVCSPVPVKPDGFCWRGEERGER